MWAQTIVLTALFFLIALGFGLFVLAIASSALIEASGLTRLQLIVLGFAIGGPGTGVFLQLLSLASSNLHVGLGSLLVVAMSVGYIAAGRHITE